MPVKITSLNAKSVEERMLDFRKKIKGDDGYSVQEVCEKIGAKPSSVGTLIMKYGVRLVSGGRMKWFLVNEKTRAKYAD